MEIKRLEIDREDMLALTRRMTVKRSSITRIAGAYIDPDVHRSQELQEHISIRTDLWTGLLTPVS